MSSLLDYGLIRTAVVEQVVAPIACQLCRLMLLCDNAEDPQQFTQLEGAAQTVAKATENLAAAASRRIRETEDEVLHVEMSSLLEPVSVSGQHVLLAAQKLSIQSSVPEHREELISATQNVFLMVVKVLLVDDDASVRRVVHAADLVLERLSELGSSSDIKSLLKSFRGFSEALLCLSSLTAERANSLQDPRQTKQLFDSLETLRRCISMLHTAMCTTIKHPNSEQAQQAKRYILEKVHSTIRDIVFTLKSECGRGPMGSCGFYTQRRNNLLQLLASSSTYSFQDSGFDSMIRDLVFHCMVVANTSRREHQQGVVSHCHHILQLWSDIKKTLKSLDDLDDAGPSTDETSTLLVQEIQMLDRALVTAVLYQVLDTFLTVTSTADELVAVVKQILASDSSAKMDLSFLQPVVEDFISSMDRIIEVADFVSAVTVDAKSLDGVENSRACLARLRARIAPLSLELADNSVQTVQKLHEVCQKWEEDSSQLQDALSDVMDVREFTSVGIDEMVVERLRCDDAYREQSYQLFDEHATNLICHMRVVINSVRRHVDRSDNPIYRNGLLVLLKQVQASQTKVTESIKDMLSGSQLIVEMYSTFTDNVSTVIQHFKVLREGLDGQQHPHLLSPLRDEARQPDVSRACSPVKDTCGLNQVYMFSACDSPAFKVTEGDSQAELEQADEETIEAELVHKYDINDLKIPAVSDEPKLIHNPAAFDLLPLLYEVVTVTKRKDVTALNQTCTGVLEVSNCYVQAAKEALVIVDAVDCQTLESFRAELVSLTPLLIQTAQEMAMSSALSTDSIYKYITQFSDLINNIRKVLLPVAGTWHHAVFTLLKGTAPDISARVTQQLNDVMTLCADVVQLLISSDLTLQADGQETFSILQSKLSKAQNNTRCLVEFSSSFKGQTDQLEGLCILWGLSIKILLNSLDKMLGTATAINHLSPKKQISVLSENSLRIQEASRLTSLNCRSAYKSKQLTGYQNELKTLTEAYLRAVEECGMMPTLIQFAKSELFQRHLLIKVKVLSGHLSKENKDYDGAFRNIIGIAFFAAEHYRENITEDTEVKFKNAAQTLEENVRSVTRQVEDCLNYIRDPETRSTLRSINDHLSFQISDIISRARLIFETHYVCDTLSLDVQIQSWTAKAHFVVEEIRKQDGIHQETKEHIRAGLQGKAPDEISETFPLIPSKIHKVIFPSDTTITSSQKDQVKNVLAETHVKTTALAQYEPANTDKYQDAVHKEAASLTYTSLFLKQESNTWDPKDNRIVQVTRKMADTIFHMTQYLRKRGPIPNKQAFVTAAKDVISNCQSVTHFIRVIAIHSLDKQCTDELSLIVEQILTITNQLNIISSVNAVTPGCKSSDEILVKNAQNLLQTVLRGVHAAETACIKGLKQPEPNSDGAEATALCFQWKRNLKIHQAQQTSNPDTDELGLRKTSMHPLAPSLASQDFVLMHKNRHK